MVKEFVTATDRRKPKRFILDGDEYEWTPQKIAGTVLALINDEDEDGESPRPARAAIDWFAAGLSDKDEDRLMARLKDDDDDFDFPDLTAIIRWGIEQVSGRPTGRRRD